MSQMQPSGAWCARCRLIVDSGKFCNLCGGPLTPSRPSQPRRPILWVILGFSALALMGLCSRGNKSPEQPRATEAPPASPVSRWESDTGKIEAYTMAKQFVTDRLKAPSTADYPWYSSDSVQVVHRGEGVFVVRAHVDSQNSFGAMIRTRFVCELKNTTGDSWSLISLDTQ
jgi:hypothetical protein